VPRSPNAFPQQEQAPPVCRQVSVVSMYRAYALCDLFRARWGTFVRVNLRCYVWILNRKFKAEE
jgi:hypothetical protein